MFRMATRRKPRFMVGHYWPTFRPAFRHAPIGEVPPRALHLHKRAVQQVQIAHSLEAADEPPAVQRQGNGGHAPEKFGICALLGQAVRVVVQVVDFGAELPFAEKDGILKALGPGGAFAGSGEGFPALHRAGLEAANQ